MHARNLIPIGMKYQILCLISKMTHKYKRGKNSLTPTLQAPNEKFKF